jgi:hypothetical protein
MSDCEINMYMYSQTMDQYLQARVGQTNMEEWTIIERL